MKKPPLSTVELRGILNTAIKAHGDIAVAVTTTQDIKARQWSRSPILR